MTLSELLLSVCDGYPQDLSDDVADGEITLKLKSEKLNCDIELRLDSVYNKNYSDGTLHEVIFEFSDK